MRKPHPASPDVPADTGEGFLSRWSRRKANPRDSESEPSPPAPAGDVQPAPSAERDPEPALTDADMPPLDSLGPDSDYSPFWSPGVSDELRRLALRRLFGSPQFNIRDGLDDYDDDYTIFEPLRKTVADAFQDQARDSLKQAGGDAAQAPPAAPADQPDPHSPPAAETEQEARTAAAPDADHEDPDRARS